MRNTLRLATLPTADVIRHAMRQGWDTQSLARVCHTSEAVIWNILAQHDNASAPEAA